MSFIGHYWWAIIVTVGFGIYVWRLVLRAQRYDEELKRRDPQYKPPFEQVSPMRNIIGLIILLGLIAWSLYQVGRVLTDRERPARGSPPVQPPAR